MAPGSIHLFVHELQKLLISCVYKTSCGSLGFFYKYGERLRAAKLLARVTQQVLSRAEVKDSVPSGPKAAFLSHCLSQESVTTFLLASERTELNYLIITSRGKVPQGTLSYPHIGPEKWCFYHYYPGPGCAQFLLVVQWVWFLLDPFLSCLSSLIWQKTYPDNIKADCFLPRSCIDSFSAMSARAGAKAELSTARSMGKVKNEQEMMWGRLGTA